MICVVGFDGYFKWVSPAFDRILGYNREELLGRPFVEFVHPDDRNDTDVETGEISDNGRATVHFQNRYIDKDGGVHWIEWTSVGVPEEERIYAVARDVTERKLLEQELELRSRSDPLTGMLNRAASMRRCAPSPASSPKTCARPTPSVATRAAWSPASAATSSPCCCLRPTRRAPRPWGRGSSPRSPPSP